MSMQQPHLYVIFYDWELGYSFHKIDLSPHAPVLIPEGIARGSATSLPPHFFRLQAERGWPIFFTAIGSKILSMHPREEGVKHDNDSGVSFDVHSETFAFIPRHADQDRPVYFPIGNKLFTLGEMSFQMLDFGVQKSPIGPGLSWSSLVDVPVDSMEVISHAVFPDGRTIFVSVGFVAVEGTYSFHFSEAGSLCMWKHHGEWTLPFHGSGYFDSKLNTWIGLSLYRDKPGHICSCDLASTTTQRRPDVKYTEDDLFTKVLDERHVGATLVYMGHKSKFCLVECILIEEPCNFSKENTDQEDEEDTDHYMLRLTTFSLKYDRNGNLTTRHRRVRYYEMPKHVSRLVRQCPVAFWM